MPHVYHSTVYNDNHKLQNVSTFDKIAGVLLAVVLTMVSLFPWVSIGFN